MEAGQSRRELIVIAKPEVGLRVAREGISATTNTDTSSLSSILGRHNAAMTPLFGASEEHLKSEASALAASGAKVPDLSVYYHVEAPDEQLDRLADELRQNALVDAAYVKPAGDAPVAAPLSHDMLNQMAPRVEEPPAVTPDFTSRQGYLDAAPGGIDARYAWTQAGGGGAGVKIIDCEWAWNQTHEDLTANQSGVVVGTAGTDVNHGTAVQGEMGGNRNAFGVTGICPDANRRFAAFSLPTASVIRSAANALGRGDLLLLEIHRAGPGASGAGQDGYIAIEWWPDDFDAILYATSRGIVVVEAAGNGARNLDDPIYDKPSAGFPSTWRNPFRRGARDSGAILVGAGAPPPGTHGSNWGADRSRLDFSNYGSTIDAQGWGREVTTTGYGDLQGGTNANLHYTNVFSGTSSASPIVTGALACVQGVMRAAGRTPLTAGQARSLLRSTGSAQQDQPGRPATQRIGNRPNLKQLIPAALQKVSMAGTQFTGSLAAKQTSRWFSHDWPAEWHVIWAVVSTSPDAAGSQLKWRVLVERASFATMTYWIEVTNLSAKPITFEGRYNVLGW